MQQGVLYESMNMAALWSLPVVFCCINNQYGMGTRVDRSAGRVAFDERARAFGLNAAIIDGQDVEQAAEQAERIITGARNGKPGFISLTCFRFFGHARLDKSPYRSDEEEAEGRQKDPLAFARSTLIDRKTVTSDRLDSLDADVAREMDAAVEHAIASKSPELSTMFDHVFDAKELPPKPLRRHLAQILSEDRA
jgi:pyruvate dehydrogenase E1 component alpha subunit